MTHLSRYAFSIGAAVALLAGCGGSKPLAGVPESPVVTTQANRSGSWMLPEARREELVYVSAPGLGNVYVYSFPAAKLVGTLTGLIQPWGECTDKAGDVWIADDSSGVLQAGTMIEYAHGGTKPIATLNDGDPPLNCSVDATTGNLAVASNYHSQRVAIYAKARGQPQYRSAKDAGPWGCAYDGSGNLFVAATIDEYTSYVYWLPKGGKRLIRYRLTPSTFADRGVAWDGQHLVVTSDGEDLLRYTRHDQIGDTVIQYLIVNRSFWIEGRALVAVANYAVAFYTYPRGGYPFKVMTNSYVAGGITISV